MNPVLNGTVYQTGNVYTNPGAPIHVVQVHFIDLGIFTLPYATDPSCSQCGADCMTSLSLQGTSGVFQDFKFVHPQPDWSAVRMGKLGYGRMHVFNATHIFYEFLGLESRAQEDSFWLIKSN